MGIEITIQQDKDTEALLARLPIALRTKYLKTGLRKEGDVVKAVAKADYPRSANTGSRDMWSEQTRAERAGVKALADTLGVEVRDYGDVFVMIVGPVYPAGALSHLIEFGHELVLYGQPTGTRVPPNPVMRRAVATTETGRGQLLTQTLMAGIEAEAS
jgi:hypothetical protein